MSASSTTFGYSPTATDGLDLDYSTTYKFDLASNRLEMKKTVSGGIITTTYGYDDNDRIEWEKQEDATPANDDRYTDYDFNATEQIGKTVYAGVDTNGSKIEKQTLSYNLQGRLAGSTHDTNGDGTTDTTTSYLYNTAGIRTSNTVNGVATQQLIDSINPTGYAQVLEEISNGALVRSSTRAITESRG